MKTRMLGQSGLDLGSEDLARIHEAAVQIEIKGARLPDAALKMTGL